MNPISIIIGFLRTLYLRKQLGGEVVATETVIETGHTTLYKLTVKNTGAVAAKYRCLLSVEGKPTGKRYIFRSKLSDMVGVGNLMNMYVHVALPESSIPLDKTEAAYEVISILCAAG